MTRRNRVFSTALVCSFAVIGASASAPVMAGDAGAFIGGVVTAKVLNNMSRRTEAEEAQAQAAQSQAYSQPAPAQPAQQSTEQKLQELDKLAAGGYITPEEYQAKKQAILDSM